jgi:hypothetical protein
MANQTNTFSIEWDINEKERFKELIKNISKRSKELSEKMKEKVKQNLLLISENPKISMRIVIKQTMMAVSENFWPFKSGLFIRLKMT